MDKQVLLQYCEVMEEIKDIRRRIRELDKFLENPPIVADTVKGSRADLTIGPIKVNGFPDPMLYRKKRAAERYRKLLTTKEAELLELTTKAEEYIEAIEKPDYPNFFLGVQWHPEYLWDRDEAAMGLFQAFVDACK